MNKLFLFLIPLLLFSCQADQKEWKLDREISLDDVAPIGIVQLGDHLWISDGDNNRIAHLDTLGKIIDFHDGFERPMHLATDGEKLFIPEYGKDQITVFSATEEMDSIESNFDAPAGVDIDGERIAVADFYNHQIAYYDKEWKRFGKEGKGEGSFYYPTDVQLKGDKIYVADAYNNRVQVLDTQGNFLFTLGTAEKINAATGIFVSDAQIFVTDFENDRVLIYDLQGKLQQIINEGLEKPTDMIIAGNELLVINYKSKSLAVFTL